MTLKDLSLFLILVFVKLSVGLAADDESKCERALSSSYNLIFGELRSAVGSKKPYEAYEFTTRHASSIAAFDSGQLERILFYMAKENIPFVLRDFGDLEKIHSKINPTEAILPEFLISFDNSFIFSRAMMADHPALSLLSEIAIRSIDLDATDSDSLKIFSTMLVVSKNNFFPKKMLLNFANFDDRYLHFLKNLPKSLEHLDISGRIDNYQTNEKLAEIIASLPHLQHLRLSVRNSNNDHLYNVYNAILSKVPQLKSLELVAEIEDHMFAGLITLLPDSLKTLKLEGSKFGEQSARALGQRHLPHLKNLDLSNSPVANHLEYLQPCAGQLETLRLYDSGLTDVNIYKLKESGLLQGVVNLDIGSNQKNHSSPERIAVTEKGLRLLLQSGELASLKRLSIWSHHLMVENYLRVLAQSPISRQLLLINWYRSYNLSSEVVQLLVDSSYLNPGLKTQLRNLQMSESQTGIRKLANDNTELYNEIFDYDRESSKDTFSE
jgi:hypothetical protein